ncbi:unnamed protein product [Schistocephalus solidus]|uniref:Uncharacterized protein n=1 Tax=Schistocephalus solidus TaxID=70667 RepID=A0A183SWE2_SCHSO|nr:unnamed protein product [Schistocephalus solidus]
MRRWRRRRELAQSDIRSRAHARLQSCDLTTHCHLAAPWSYVTPLHASIIDASAHSRMCACVRGARQWWKPSDQWWISVCVRARLHARENAKTDVGRITAVKGSGGGVPLIDEAVWPFTGAPAYTYAVGVVVASLSVSTGKASQCPRPLHSHTKKFDKIA